VLTVADFDIAAVFAHPDDAELAAGGYEGFVIRER